MMVACRDEFCSDMSMLQVCIPQWLKAIQTSPEWRGVKSCRNWWKQRNVGWETWQRREGDGKIQGCAKIDASCFCNKYMQVTKMQWCNLAYQDVSDPVVSFQRKLLTSNVLDTSRHRDVKLLFSSPWGWAAKITMGKHENWKSSWGKEGQQMTTIHICFPQLQGKSVKKGRMWDRNKISTSPNWQNFLKLFDPSEVMELKLADPQKGSLCKKVHCISFVQMELTED